MELQYFTYFLQKQSLQHRIIPANEHQLGNVDNNSSSHDRDIDIDIESFTSPPSFVNEDLLSALTRFRRPDQVLLVDIHTVSPIR